MCVADVDSVQCLKSSDRPAGQTQPTRPRPRPVWLTQHTAPVSQRFHRQKCPGNKREAHTHRAFLHLFAKKGGEKIKRFPPLYLSSGDSRSCIQSAHSSSLTSYLCLLSLLAKKIHYLTFIKAGANRGNHYPKFIVCHRWQMTVFFLPGGSDVNLLKHDVKWHKQRHTRARINSKRRVTPRRIMNNMNRCHHYPTQCICYHCAHNEVSVWWLVQRPIAQRRVIKWPRYNRVETNTQERSLTGYWTTLKMEPTIDLQFVFPLINEIFFWFNYFDLCCGANIGCINAAPMLINNQN